MGRNSIWIVQIALVLAIYAAPAEAQVSVAVGVGTPHVGASVVVGAPAYGVYPYYPYAPYPVPYPVSTRRITTRTPGRPGVCSYRAYRATTAARRTIEARRTIAA